MTENRRLAFICVTNKARKIVGESPELPFPIASYVGNTGKYFVWNVNYYPAGPVGIAALSVHM